MTRKAKPKKTSPSMEMRRLTDGTAVLPVVKNKTIYPDTAERVLDIEKILVLLPLKFPNLFSGQAQGNDDKLSEFLIWVRFFCDFYGLDFQDIDRQAHAEYNGLLWHLHTKYTGEKK